MHDPSLPPAPSGRALIPALRSMFSPLAELLLPYACLGCRHAGESLCPRCAEPLRAPAVRVRAGPGEWPELRRHGIDEIVSVTEYDQHLATLIHAWKDGGRLELTPILGQALARSVDLLRRSPSSSGSSAASGTSAASGNAPLLLVPVPSSRSGVRRRGVDVVHQLARTAAARLRTGGDSVRAAAVLQQRAGVLDQAGLDRAARARNVGAAFAVRHEQWRRVSAALMRDIVRAGVAEAHIVVVDDVVTTGSSAAEAVRALRAALSEDRSGVEIGALSVVGVAAVGNTPRHGRAHPERPMFTLRTAAAGRR